MAGAVLPQHREDNHFPVHRPPIGPCGFDDAGVHDAGVQDDGGGRVRVDLRRVLTGLRHLPASTEPARVFTALAAVCTPALCDETVIDMTEHGGHRYRIRRPGPAVGPIGTDDPTPVHGPVPSDGAGWSGAGSTVTIAGHTLYAGFGNPLGGGPAYTGQLIARWHGYQPDNTDAALLGVLIDHATALVHRERTTTHLTDTHADRRITSALDGTQRIAAATGILMALHHLSSGQARDLLHRAADRGHRSLRDTADTVLHTGALPGTDRGAPPPTPPAVTTDHDPHHSAVRPAP
jgi:hypothetical protein